MHCLWICQSVSQGATKMSINSSSVLLLVWFGDVWRQLSVSQITANLEGISATFFYCKLHMSSVRTEGLTGLATVPEGGGA